MPKTSIKNNYCPIFLNVADKQCVVVGGGLVAEQKIRMLLKFNTSILVISPDVTKTISLLSDKEKIKIIRREYRIGDLRGATLVFAATNNKEINEAVKIEANGYNIPVNVVDDPGLCDFIVPSIVKKRTIVIAISTSGNLPMLSKILRKDIEKFVSDDYLKVVRKIGEFRKYLIKHVNDSSKRKKILHEISKINVKELAKMDARTIKDIFLRKT